MVCLLKYVSLRHPSLTKQMNVDVDHPGYTNNFLINSYERRAVMYNDKSILENHHLATAFSVLNHIDNNFLAEFTKSDFKTFRETVIDMVFATGMATRSLYRVRR
jgi:hypothetical protein